MRFPVEVSQIPRNAGGLNLPNINIVIKETVLISGHEIPLL